MTQQGMSTTSQTVSIALYGDSMTTFAERMGHREARNLIQKNDLDNETRVELWNDLVFLKKVFDNVANESYRTDQTEHDLLQSVWCSFYHRPLDEIPRNDEIWNRVKSTIIKDSWFDALSLIEHIVKRLSTIEHGRLKGIFSALVDGHNETFEKYLVAYRFIGTLITPIDSDAEVAAVQSVLDQTDHLAGVRHSLQRAVELLADRKQPDYSNSIKESISAVEAIVKKVTGKGTLGDGIKKLESSGINIHPALKEAWLKMYGWTSDANGIRHAGIEAADANQALAKYALVSCSAFISYLLDEGQKTGLLGTEEPPV